MIDQPITGDRIWSINNRTKFNGKVVRTRQCKSISDAIVACTDPLMFKDKFTLLQKHIFSRVPFVRYGTDCWGYSMCAIGIIDAVIEKDLKIWDLAAAEPIIKSAGGLITTWEGKSIGSDDTACAAGDPKLHSLLLDKLSAFL